jgi:hypothetical protein
VPQPDHGGHHTPPADHTGYGAGTGHGSHHDAAPDMSKFLVNDHGHATDPSAFHQHAGNDLFNFATSPGNALPHGANWTSAVELDIHGNDGSVAPPSGWTHQVESNVVVIDNHADSHLKHVSPSTGAAGTGDPAHHHLDKIHW